MHPVLLRTHKPSQAFSLPLAHKFGTKLKKPDSQRVYYDSRYIYPTIDRSYYTRKNRNNFSMVNFSNMDRILRSMIIENSL